MSFAPIGYGWMFESIMGGPENSTVQKDLLKKEF